MIDKDLLRLLGSNKKYIGFCVGWMVLGLFANVGINCVSVLVHCTCCPV